MNQRRAEILDNQRRAEHLRRKREGRKSPESLGTCTCGKQKYRSRKQARAAARAIFPGDHQQAYECHQVPGVWHHGHLPEWLLHGEQRPVWRKAVAS